jgi:hypothetical protein
MPWDPAQSSLAPPERLNDLMMDRMGKIFTG